MHIPHCWKSYSVAHFPFFAIKTYVVGTQKNNRNFALKIFALLALCNGHLPSVTYLYNREYCFIFQTFEGNRDSSSDVRHVFMNELQAQCVRIHPKDYSAAPGLRFEILGCRTYGKL